MASTDGISSALAGVIVPPSKNVIADTTTEAAAAAPTTTTVTTEVPASDTQSMEQLLKETNLLKTEVERSAKTLEKIDTGRKKAAANRDRSIEGRQEIQGFNERIDDLRQQMNAMTKDSDPNFPSRQFDKSKRSTLKILSTLSEKLNKVDKHLEK